MKKLIIGFLTAVVLSTLFISKSFNDNFFIPTFFGIVFILSIAFILQLSTSFFVTKKAKVNLAFSKIDISLLAWYFISLLSILISNTIFNNHQFIVFSLLLFLYFAIKQECKTGFIDIFSTFSIILLIAGSFQVLYGILQFTGKMQSNTIFKVVGNFGNPGLLSQYLSILFIWFLTVVLFNHQHKGLKIASAVFCSIALVFIIFLFNRASWIILIVCVPLLLHFRFGIFSFFTKLSLPKKTSIVVVLLLLAGAAVPILYGLKKDSSDGRLFIWKRTAELIKDHPITGVGYDAFSPHFNSYQAAYFKLQPNDEANAHIADNIGYAFNEFLQVMSETGILGLLAFIAIFIFSIVQLAKYKPSKSINDESFQTIAIVVIIAFVILSFVAYPFRVIGISPLFFIFLSIASLNDKQLFSFNIEQSKLKLLSGVLIITLFAFVIYEKSQLTAYSDWHKATVAIESGNNDAFMKMEELYHSLEHDKLFLYNYGTELSLAGNYSKSSEILEKAKPTLNNYNILAYLGNDYEALGHLDKAIECFEKADNQIPSRIYTKFRLFRLYDKVKDPRAVLMARKVVEMPAKGLSDNVDILRQKAKEYLYLHK